MIYFAGAVQGGRHDQVWYKDLIEHLQNYGEVLTSKLGDEDILHVESQMNTANIYNTLVEHLKQADVLVAEVTTPSLGVGYEIGLAESMDKDIICLFRNSSKKTLSVMISGNDNLDICWYDKLEDAKEAIDEYFKK